MSKGKRKARKSPPSRAGAPQRKSEESQAPELQGDVRLRPFLGINPGVYLTVLYALAVLGVLFMLLFYKGIRDRGTFLTVQSFPPGAAMTVDGIYAGSTPCEVLVKAGLRSVGVSKPYFTPQILDQEFPGPVFGTLFVRPRRTWAPKLVLADPPGLAAHALRDFSSNPGVPEILSQTALAAYQSDPETRAELDHFVDESKYFITTPLQLQELIRARSTLDAGSGVLTPTSLLASVTNIILSNAQYENAPFWLSVVLPDERAKKIVESPWFIDFLAAYREHYATLLAAAGGSPAAARSAPLQLLGLLFRPIPGGTLVLGASEERALTVQVPHPVEMAAFFLAETEVSAELYRRFLDDTPEWRPGEAARLMAEGLATEQYLEGWQGDRPPASGGRNPVVNVSFYAAEAFCRWLTKQLPTALSGYEARLPSEAEWEWAARGGLLAQPYPLGVQPAGAVFFEAGIQGPVPVGASSPNGFGLKDMSGNVWEWCTDWHSPVKYLFSSWDPKVNAGAAAAEPPVGSEKVVRGGSWSNQKELVKIYTRGSQPPTWCTPFLGFRVALVKVEP